MANDITLKELILEFQPFSPELKAWCKSHPEFFDALKNIHPDKFISPACIMCSYPPTGDEVIGVYSFHYQLNNPIFKQDYIVNADFKNEKFTLYTNNPAGSSKYVQNINNFFDKYGRYGYLRAHHHLTFEELPEDIKWRARAAMQLAERVKNVDTSKITQAHINKIYAELQAIEEKDRSYRIQIKD